jgi:hypothetical protein
MEQLPTAVARHLQRLLLKLPPLALVLVVMTGKPTGITATLVTKPGCVFARCCRKEASLCADLQIISGKAQLSLL